MYYLPPKISLAQLSSRVQPTVYESIFSTPTLLPERTFLRIDVGTDTGTGQLLSLVRASPSQAPSKWSHGIASERRRPPSYSAQRRVRNVRPRHATGGTPAPHTARRAARAAAVEQSSGARWQNTHSIQPCSTLLHYYSAARRTSRRRWRGVELRVLRRKRKEERTGSKTWAWWHVSSLQPESSLALASAAAAVGVSRCCSRYYIVHSSHHPL